MATVALLLLAAVSPVDMVDYGVQAVKVKAHEASDIIEEDDDASEMPDDKVDVQIQALQQHAGAPMTSPYMLLTQTQAKPMILAQQTVGSPNQPTIMDMQLVGLNHAQQPKQSLVQTSQEIQSSTVSETGAQAGSELKATVQKPTSGAIDLEGDMLQVMTQTDNGLKIQQENRRAPAHSEFIGQRAQLNQMSGTERHTKDQFDKKNNEIRSKIQQLEDQIQHEEQLAKKLKGDQIAMKQKKEKRVSTESLSNKLDGQISDLRNDLRISGEESKLAKLKTEQAMIQRKIQASKKKSLMEDQEDDSDSDDTRITQSSLAESTMRDDKKEEDKKKEEEKKKADEKKDAKPEDAKKKEEEEKKKGEDAKKAEEEKKKEEEKKAADKKEEEKKKEADAKKDEKPPEPKKDDAKKDDGSAKELLEKSSQILKRSEAMTETLKAIEEKLAAKDKDKKKDDDDKDKKKDKDKDEEKEKKKDKDDDSDKKDDDDDDKKDGWRQVQKYFKGKKGAGKAKKFIKFLNMLSSMEE